MKPTVTSNLRLSPEPLPLLLWHCGVPAVLSDCLPVCWGPLLCLQQTSSSFTPCGLSWVQSAATYALRYCLSRLFVTTRCHTAAHYCSAAHGTSSTLLWLCVLPQGTFLSVGCLPSTRGLVIARCPAWVPFCLATRTHYYM